MVEALVVQRGPRPESIAAAGVCFIVLVVAAVTWLMNTASYREWGGVVIAVVLAVVSLPILAKQARREGTPHLFWFFLSALLAKFLFAAIRHFVTFDVYGVADAVVYNRVGTELAIGFRAGDFSVDLPGFTDTEFIKLLTGIVYSITGPTTWGGFFIFAWLAFWGLFLTYRAFRVAMPDADPRIYKALLFFLPSLLYWPASIGKEAWMVFALGIAALGCAHVFKRNVGFGGPLLILGSAMAGVVRPHVAGFVGVGVAGAILLMKPRRDRLTQLAPIARSLRVGAAALALVGAVVFAGTFLQDAGVNTSGGLGGTLESVADRTSKGDSRFSTPSFSSPTAIPQAAITVLFRPFVFEASNALMLLTAIEAGALMLLSLARAGSIWQTIRTLRTNPYLAFAGVYVMVSIVALSSLGNFGLLARQRTMLLPIFLMLLFVPRSRDAASDSQHAPLDGVLS